MEAAKADQGLARPPTGGWQEIHLPDRWTSRWRGYNGVVWYRLTWRRDCDEPVAFSLERLSMAGAAYINGGLLWRDFSLVEPLSRSWNRPRFGFLPESSLRRGVNELTIAVVGRPWAEPGLGRVEIGEPQTLYSRYRTRWFIRQGAAFANIIISLVLLVLFAGLWLRQRRESLFFWFGASEAAWCLYALNLVLEKPWPWSDPGGPERLNSTAMVLLAGCFWVFCSRLLERKPLRQEVWLWSALGLMLLALWLAPIGMLVEVRNLVNGLAVGLFFFNGLRLARAAITAGRKGNFTLRALAAFQILAVSFCLHDYLVFLGLLDSIAYYSQLLFVWQSIPMAIALVLRLAGEIKRIKGSHQALEAYAEQTHKRLQANLARETALQIRNARLEGRLALARDLHDGLGGQLVSVIAQIENGDGAVNPQRTLSLLKGLREELRQVLDASTASTLTVPRHPGTWLAPLRARYGELLEEAGMGVSWQLPPRWPDGPPSAPQSIALLRFLQEACTNVIKHSRAKRIDITLDRDAAGRLRLGVTDDGIGFDIATASAHGGIGLSSMVERARQVGAHLDVQSSPGHTSVMIVLDRREPDDYSTDGGYQEDELQPG